MKKSESIINNLLFEVDSLTYRLRNIKQCFNTTTNSRLRERLFNENEINFRRVKEIYKIAELLNKKSNNEINYSSLLIEKTRRTLNETRKELNLFFL